METCITTVHTSIFLSNISFTAIMEFYYKTYSATKKATEKLRNKIIAAKHFNDLKIQ